MTEDLKDKTVVITGGALGIGFEIADNFLSKEAKVIVILDVNEKKGLEAVKILNVKYGKGRSEFIKCDVTLDLEEVSKKIFDVYGIVDVLVNNAGVSDSPKRTIDTNVRALIEWSLTFWNHMRKDKGGNGGTIMNLSSIYGFRVNPFLPIYQASKFAVAGFTRSLGDDYHFKRTGVRVIAMCPGCTNGTALIDACSFEAANEKFQEDKTIYFSQQPWQDVAVVGKAAVDIFEVAASGACWLIEGSRPIEEIKPYFTN